MTILPWDSEAAQRYGQTRAALEREGQPMGNLDMMIGAHALALEPCWSPTIERSPG